MEEQLTPEQQIAVICQMRMEWEQQRFAAEMNVRVADRISDERMRDQAISQMARAEAALAVLEEELEKVGKLAVEGDGSE